jgi:hypothetical protein
MSKQNRNHCAAECLARNVMTVPPPWCVGTSAIQVLCITSWQLDQQSNPTHEVAGGMPICSQLRGCACLPGLPSCWHAQTRHW